MIVGSNYTDLYILIFKIMKKTTEKSIKKNADFTTYKIGSKGDFLTLPNLPFESIINPDVKLSRINKKIKNQISLL